MLTILLVDDPEYCSALSDSEKRFPTVFFKVVKLDGPPSNFPSFICDHRSTRVVQVIKLPFWSMLITCKLMINTLIQFICLLVSLNVILCHLKLYNLKKIFY